MYRWELTKQIVQQRIITIVRAGSAAAALAQSRAILAGGVRVLEVALTTPGGLEAIQTLAAEAAAAKDEGALIGAGTVLDEATARAAILAGARFLVCPGLFPSVIQTAHRYGVPVLPGAATVTEIVSALEAGADLVKIFPAETLGPRFIQGVRAAIPQAPLVPTGGVSAANAGEWLSAGAVAVGVGGSLTRGTAGEITDRVRELVAAVSRA